MEKDRENAANQEECNRRLFDAIKEGKLDDIKKAIEDGADVNARIGSGGNLAIDRDIGANIYDWAMLDIAIATPKVTKEVKKEVTSVLIEHGADASKTYLAYNDPQVLALKLESMKRK